MWFFIMVFLSVFSQAFDDVFTDIPSQFDGYNICVGTGFDARMGDGKFNTTSMQGPSDPRFRVSVIKQKANDFWGSGKGIFLSVSAKEHTLAGVITNTTTNTTTNTVTTAVIPGDDDVIVTTSSTASSSATTKLLVSYPVQLGAMYRKGFLLNPSTLASLSAAIGVETADYQYSTISKDDHYLFGRIGAEMSVSVFTQWGMDMGLEITATNENNVVFDTSNTYYPPNLVVGGKLGVTYRPFSEGDDFLGGDVFEEETPLSFELPKVEVEDDFDSESLESVPDCEGRHLLEDDECERYSPKVEFN